jgi:CRP-like cAMP-binding protein
VRALGKARVLTVDEKTFLRYVHQDPSLAYQLLKMMSNRVRRLDTEVTHLRLNQRLADNNIQIQLSQLREENYGSSPTFRVGNIQQR